MRLKKSSIIAIVCFQLLASASFGQEELNLGSKLLPIDSNNIFVSDSFYSWCPSVTRGEDGLYYLFYSRWPHGVRPPTDDSLNRIFNGFSGWNKYSEIALAVSDKLEGPYRHIKTILKGSGVEGRWDRFTMHNPQVKKFGNMYYLYYTSNSYDSAWKPTRPMDPERVQWMRYNCTQAVGVVKAKTIRDFLEGRFERCDTPIMQVDNVRTFEVANNPSVDRGPDGRYYMMYKSRVPNGPMKFWMAVADAPDARFTTIANVVDDPDLSSEDPFMWYDRKHKRFYAVAKYFSASLKYAPEFGALILLESPDGIKWSLGQPSLVSLKRLRFKDGGELKLEHLERPFIYVDEKGRLRALLAAATVKSPWQGNLLQVSRENNSFDVIIPMKR